MPHRFTIRYRHATSPGTNPTLLVEDEAGTAYLFRAGLLQLRQPGPGAAERLLQLFRAPDHWAPVATTHPYTLDGLRQLVIYPPADDADDRDTIPPGQ